MSEKTQANIQANRHHKLEDENAHLPESSLIFNAVSDLILTLQISPTNQLLIANANRAFLSYYDLTISKIQGQPAQQVISPESYTSLLHQYESLNQTGEPLQYEVFEGTISENFEVFGITLTPVFSASRQCEFLIYAQSNITAQKINQASQELFATALEDAYDSIVITTANLSEGGPRIVYVNSAFTRMTGYVYEEAVGKTPRFLQGPQTDRKTLDRLKNSLKAGERFHGQAINYRKDGSQYFVEWHVAPMRNAQNEVAHFVAIQRDITKFEKTRQQLKQTKETLEVRVTERTNNLTVANAELLTEIEIRKEAQRVFKEQAAELNRRLQEMEAISSINEAINSTFDAQTIFQRIVHDIRQIIPHVDRAIIHVLDEANQRLKSKAVSGLLEHGEPALTFSVSEGVAGEVIVTKEIINIGNVQKDERFLQAGVTTDLHALLVVPILQNGRLLGTISLQSDHPNAFSPADEQLLERLSNSAAIALENARLFHIQREQRHYAELFSKISNKLNQFTSLEDLQDNIVAHLRPIMACHAAALLLISDDLAEITRVTIAPDLQMDRFLTKAAYSLSEELLQSMIIDEKPQSFTNLTNPATTPPLAMAKWVNHFAAAPLLVGQQVVGFIFIGNGGPSPFNKEISNHLTTFASHAATAIYRTRLYEYLNHSLEKEKTAREQLVQAGKLAAMGRMVASVAHELNNPLQTIKNCLYLLKDELVSPQPSINNFLTMSLNEIQRLSDLVEQLKEVYRPRKAKQMTVVQLDKLLKETHSLVMPHLRSNAVSWEWQQQFLLKRPFTYGNPDHLKQVFLNLCLNGIEAMSNTANPTLSVGFIISDNQKRIGISFHDNGDGILENFRHTIFDPFVTTKNEGMGLGLAISYDIIRQHKGEIIVQSQPDEGTTFTVWLPFLRQS